MQGPEYSFKKRREQIASCCGLFGRSFVLRRAKVSFPSFNLSFAFRRTIRRTNTNAGNILTLGPSPARGEGNEFESEHLVRSY
jgi:hypothetical protein